MMRRAFATCRNNGWSRFTSLGCLVPPKTSHDHCRGTQPNVQCGAHDLYRSVEHAMPARCCSLAWIGGTAVCDDGGKQYDEREKAEPLVPVQQQLPYRSVLHVLSDQVQRKCGGHQHRHSPAEGSGRSRAHVQPPWVRQLALQMPHRRGLGIGSHQARGVERLLRDSGDCQQGREAGSHAANRWLRCYIDPFLERVTSPSCAARTDLDRWDAETHRYVCIGG